MLSQAFIFLGGCRFQSILVSSLQSDAVLVKIRDTVTVDNKYDLFLKPK